MVARRFVKILKVEDRIEKSDFSAPATAREVAADTPSQAADREAVTRQHFLERRQVVLTDLLFNSLSVQRDRSRQLVISSELDEIEAELVALRSNLGATGARNNAGSEQVAKSDPIGLGTPKQRDTLGAVLRRPTVRKGELTDPFELSNDLGIRSQTLIKE